MQETCRRNQDTEDSDEERRWRLIPWYQQKGKSAVEKNRKGNPPKNAEKCKRTGLGAWTAKMIHTQPRYVLGVKGRDGTGKERGRLNG